MRRQHGAVHGQVGVQVARVEVRRRLAPVERLLLGRAGDCGGLRGFVEEWGGTGLEMNSQGGGGGMRVLFPQILLSIAYAVALASYSDESKRRRNSQGSERCQERREGTRVVEVVFSTDDFKKRALWVARAAWMDVAVCTTALVALSPLQP